MKKIVGDKSRLTGYRSVNVGDKKPINRLSVGKHRRQKLINWISVGKVLKGEASIFVMPVQGILQVYYKFMTVHTSTIFRLKLSNSLILRHNVYYSTKLRSSNYTVNGIII